MSQPNSFVEKCEQLGRAFRTSFELFACVDILCVLAEDHHVDILRMFHGGRNPGVPADRAKTDIEIKNLAECNIEASNAATNGGRKRPLDPNEILVDASTVASGSHSPVSSNAF